MNEPATAADWGALFDAPPADEICTTRKRKMSSLAVKPTVRSA